MSQSVLESVSEPAASIDATLRDEWLAAMDRLNADIMAWVSGQSGWSIVREPDKTIEEERIGSYKAPFLRLLSEKPKGEVRLEPIARMTRGGRGVVELYAWPALYSVRLIGNAGGSSWEILTDSGIPIRKPWNKETFLQVAEDLIRA